MTIENHFQHSLRHNLTIQFKYSFEMLYFTFNILKIVVTIYPVHDHDYIDSVF